MDMECLFLTLECHSKSGLGLIGLDLGTWELAMVSTIGPKVGFVWSFEPGRGAGRTDDFIYIG